MLTYAFVLAVGLVAGTISGIIGTGSSIMLLPVLVYEFGPKQAVPIMAVAAVMANLSRIMAYWREVDWRATLAYSATGIPAAALGARTLIELPSQAVDITMGLFFIAMVPVRHWLARHDLQATLWHLAIGGALIGLGTALLLLFNGRIAGISGILGGLLRPLKGDMAWRIVFITAPTNSPAASANASRSHAR